MLDPSGNSASTTRVVNVVDTTAPVISLLGDNPLNIDLGSSFIDPGAFANDNYDGIINSVVVTGSPDTSVVGTYFIFYNVSDSREMLQLKLQERLLLDHRLILL